MGGHASFDLSIALQQNGGAEIGTLFPRNQQLGRQCVRRINVVCVMWGICWTEVPSNNVY